MVKQTLAGLKLITPANRADYRQLIRPLPSACWPEVMLHDAIADEHWSALLERFPDYQFGLLDPQTNTACVMANSVPLRWDGELGELPEEGWDWALERAVRNHEAGDAPNIHCAIQIAIHPAYRGRALSGQLVQVMRSIGRSKGFRRLIAPVRPSQKADYPLSDIDRYVEWKTPDSLPFDAWLRVHARADARIVKVCHRSMTIRASVQDWQAWTGLTFPESGPYYVPGTLKPVDIDLSANEGLYTEPNVWMVHDLSEVEAARAPSLHDV